MTFVAGVTLTVERPGGTDRYGNPQSPTTHDVDDCALAPAGSTELVNGQATTIDDDTAYMPYDADVTSSDRIEVPAGQPLPEGTYEVNGSPARYVNPFTGTPVGAVVRLRRATG